MKVGDLVMKSGGIHDGLITIVLKKEKPRENFAQGAGDLITVMSHERPHQQIMFYERGCEVISESW